MEGIKDLTMFDKSIDVTFYKTKEEYISEWLVYGSIQATGMSIAASTVATPLTGIKPAISISGQFHNKSEANNIILNLTNFYADADLTSYSYVKIIAGYIHGVKTEFRGHILHCYPSAPPPDSVMTFEVLLGDVELYYTETVNSNYPIKTPLEFIFGDIATAMDLELQYNYDITKGARTLVPVAINGLSTVREFILKLKEMYPGLVVKFDTQNLYVADRMSSYGIIHRLKYISSAKKDAAGFTIEAVWNPLVMPWDYIEANPVYYAQSFGGQNITGNVFRVITVDFSFSTIGNDNNMSVLATEVREGS
jgi:hypothetical protein